MPLIRRLPAPGSPCRFLGLSSCLSRSSLHPHTSSTPALARRIRCISNRAIGPRSSRPFNPASAPHTPSPRRNDSVRQSSSQDELVEEEDDLLVDLHHFDDTEGWSSTYEEALLTAPELNSDDPHDETVVNNERGRIRKGAQLSRNKMHAMRPSRPTVILDSIQNDARDLYSIGPRTELTTPPGGSAVTLYSILSRCVHDATVAPWVGQVNLSEEEASLLHSQGYSDADVKAWVNCLLRKRSAVAATVFRDQSHFPPFFLVLLFLRRKRMKRSALGMIMRHVAIRNKVRPLTWDALRILSIRLLRHARVLWPESIPWIASLYATETPRIMQDSSWYGFVPSRLQQSISRFSNTMLSLISLPTSAHPLLDSAHQEEAQFQVLRFMQSCDPAMVVTRTGFRAVVRNQLMHPKTSREREWAALKGPSWPPWKVARTAMDEEKGYEFGASRALQILHRMYEAGYAGRSWEDIASVYAGWDKDMSPTIQTRTHQPNIWTEERDERKPQVLLWAARIRATRSRREAWACFLACESSETSTSAVVYLAMFEKLHYPEVEMYDRAEQAEKDSEGAEEIPLLPGDLKEVQPDPRSPLDLVEIREPVPIYQQLYKRMLDTKTHLTGRLFAFLVETHPDFDVVLDLLEYHRTRFYGGLQKLLESDLTKESPVPDYFLGAFITFLCRFGRYSEIPAIDPMLVAEPNHMIYFRSNKHYLLKYAYTLLMHYRPAYRPAWTAYMGKTVFGFSLPKDLKLQRYSFADAQYTMLLTMFKELEALDMDPDEEQFRILCTCVRYAAQAAHEASIPIPAAQDILRTAPKLLRTSFHALFGASVEQTATSATETAIPAHAPVPAILHAYVRALGVLRDYEGLYSFSTWAVYHHAEITVRANTQRSGPQALYRTFVALRAALEGSLHGDGRRAPEELLQLVKDQLEDVEEWGWPKDEHVTAYVNNGLRGAKAPRGRYDWHRR